MYVSNENPSDSIFLFNVTHTIFVLSFGANFASFHLCLFVNIVFDFCNTQHYNT